MKYVIIGASAAGLAAAQGIRKVDKKSEITILAKEAYLPYSRPSISYYLKGTVDEKDMYLRKPSFYKENGINVITSCEATKIDTDKKVVRAGRREFPYDVYAFGRWSAYHYDCSCHCRDSFCCICGGC